MPSLGCVGRGASDQFAAARRVKRPERAQVHPNASGRTIKTAAVRTTKGRPGGFMYQVTNGGVFKSIESSGILNLYIEATPILAASNEAIDGKMAL